MKQKRNKFCLLMLILTFVVAGTVSAQPIFENQTPKGFSASDSTAQTAFETESPVSILVDLNQPATAEYPVTGNFQKLERAVPYFEAGDVAQHLSQAVAVDEAGVIHRAWVQRRGFENYGPGSQVYTTPAYGVVYSKSFDGGKTFSDTISVSGTLKFDTITCNMAMGSGFSTVDLVVDSRGNPRVTYAMDWSADGATAGGLALRGRRTRGAVNAAPNTGIRVFKGIFFNYSNDGGSSWLPNNSAVAISDTTQGLQPVLGAAGYQAVDQIVGQNSQVGFPRMAITSTDDIFITYQRGMSGLADGATNNGDPDIMLAKMDADSLKLGQASQVLVGSKGTTNSLGGIRIDPDNEIGIAPDIFIGDDDVIHIVYWDPTDAAERIFHKSAPAEDWSDAAVAWRQTVDGGMVGTLDVKLADAPALSDDGGTYQNKTMHLFPTLLVDREQTPDRIYVFWKHADAKGLDENIMYASKVYDGVVGASGGWGNALPVFPTGSTTPYVSNVGAGLFVDGSIQQIEHHWMFVDRVTAVAEPKVPGVRSDIHIAFSGGSSAGSKAATSMKALKNALYYTRFNGSEWELPQVVATGMNSNGGVESDHSSVFGADLALLPGSDDLVVTFTGGEGKAATGGYSGFGAQAWHHALAGGKTEVINTKPVPYFKVLGRSSTFEDISEPVGAYQYILNYDPVNPPEASAMNLIPVLVANPSDGLGIGASTPASSKAPGGFLTGQWYRNSLVSLGLTSLSPADDAGIYKGAKSAQDATADVGVFQGLVDDDGSDGLGEWGDPGDKVGLLVKLNVLGSDSVVPYNGAGVGTNFGNVVTITASTSARLISQQDDPTGVRRRDGKRSQSISIAQYYHHGAVKGPGVSEVIIPTFYTGVSSNVAINGTTPVIKGNINPTVSTKADGADLHRSAAQGSYFIMGPRIDIVASNEAPYVAVITPDANSAKSGFSNDSYGIQYRFYDRDNDFGSGASDLKGAIYVYPDNGLASVKDIVTFGTLVVDENDDISSNTDAPATDDFTEGSSPSANLIYTWDDPGVAYQTAYGYAAITKMLDGEYYIYLVADDGTNKPVFSVSDGPLRIRHIPIIRQVAPVASDTVDTGEFSNANKANPYSVKFTADDYDDNAQVKLFFAQVDYLGADDVLLTGEFPDFEIDLEGAEEIQGSGELRTDNDNSFDFNVVMQGSEQDSVIAQGNYYIYAVAADDDSFAVKASSTPLSVRHSPAFEFTAPLTGVTQIVDPSAQSRFTVQWQRGRSDVDIDGNAFISLYYTGVDPSVANYSGTDSTALMSSTGGSAELIVGNLREDGEGAEDQYVWDLRNPLGALPKLFLPAAGAANATDAGEVSTNSHTIYQSGATVDTAFIYAVLHDTLGNTRVQAGGAIVLRSGDAGTFQPTPKVTMKTPPAGGQTIVNGDIVRLEWDSFLMDDGTGTDDAYLRLYAAPKGKYSTLTALESNASGRAGGNGDVIVINHMTGTISGANDTEEAYDRMMLPLRESDESFYLWDTKTPSFDIKGTPTELDIFIAGSVDPRFGRPVYATTTTSRGSVRIDSVASGMGSQAQKAVLSKAPGSLRVEGADPIYSIELGPGTMTASSGDTLSLSVQVNSQGSSIDLMAMHLDVPREYFDVVDMDAETPGVQPFEDIAGAFKTPSTIAQNDTTEGTDEMLHLNFVESILSGEVIGNATKDSSQVAAYTKLVVKRFSGGAPFTSLLKWSSEDGRRTAFRRGKVELAAPAREGFVTLTPRGRVIATAPLEGRTDYSSTLDAHLRIIGSTHDIKDASYLAANDADVDSTAALDDSVQVVSNSFGTFTLTEIPPGTYELTVKAPGYVSGRTDTLVVFNGATLVPDPTFSSDILGNLSPQTPLGYLRGGDATGDNQVDIADANLVYSLWNETPGDASFVADADVNADGVINSLDLGFVTTNFGNEGYGAPPVFKATGEDSDNATAKVEVVGVQEVESWWSGRVFEVTAKATGMSDVMAYELVLGYDPDRVKVLPGAAVVEGDVFANNSRGSLFFSRTEPGRVEVASGRVGREWSARGDAELVTVRFMTLTEDPGQIEVLGGQFVNSAYQANTMRVEKAQALPKVAALHQNFPNPFNPSTEIRFDIPNAREVQLRVFNQLGQTVRTLVDSRMKAGTYRIKWDGKTEAGNSISSGVYFYSLEAGEFSQIRKMTLVK
jgi:hypothetical protein